MNDLTTPKGLDGILFGDDILNMGSSQVPEDSSNPSVDPDVIPELTRLAEEYYSKKMKVDGLEKERREIGDRILELIGPGISVTLDDGLVVTTVAAGTQNRFDSPRFKKDHPDIYSEYIKESVTRAYTKVNPDRKSDEFVG